MDLSTITQRAIEALIMTLIASGIAAFFARPRDRAQARSFNASANRDNATAVQITTAQLVEALEKIEDQSARIETQSARIEELEANDSDKSKKIEALETARKEDHAEIRILRIQQRENMAEIVGLRDTVSDLMTGVRILTSQIVDELHAQPKWSPSQLVDHDTEGDTDE
jgi:chromosome segregation ATPase